jgi:hypothetical protein
MPSGRIVLAGHSLGAALAIRAAFDFAPNGEAVVAFVAPRVWGRQFLERSQALDLDRRTIRFTQLTDVVSRTLITPEKQPPFSVLNRCQLLKWDVSQLQMRGLKPRAQQEEVIPALLQFPTNCAHCELQDVSLHALP